ncbi:hypothetical protein G3A39_41005 [Paraburkholderia aspalathi]|nr:hypothetical protein [Paraburkholderia aspalathi]
MIDYAVFVEGTGSLRAQIEAVENWTPAITLAASRALNATADRTRTDSADAIRRQVNFPASYLNPSQGRLVVNRRASENSLEAIITGRRAATSLARFSTSGIPGKRGLSVAVKPGRNVDMPNSFLMKLRSGSSIDTKNNLGLAVRTKSGARPDRAYMPVRISDSLWLLYGPSVNQVFKTVRETVRPDAENFLAAEFQRLLDLDL